MKEEAKQRVSVIVPVCNEEEVIPFFCERLREMAGSAEYFWEFVFVNDGSTDRSFDVLTEEAAGDSRFRIVSLSRNFGHQAALTAGMDVSTGDAVICMDVDLQHPPEVIPEMIGRWEGGCDIVYAVRNNTEQVGLFKRLTADLFYRLFNLLSPQKIHRSAADFRLISARVVSIFRKDIRERNRFLRGLMGWVGFKSSTVEYDVDRRRAGVSKYTFPQMVKFAVTGVTSFSMIPLRISLAAGLLGAAACVLFGLYAICVRLITDKAMPGWASLVVLMSFINALQLIFIGLLGEYIGKIFEEVKQRPIYIISETFRDGEN